MPIVNLKSLCLCLSLGLSCATTPSRGEQPRRLCASDSTLQAKTLTANQRQEIYLQLIENFVGWAEHSGEFLDSDEFEPGGGYFEAAGHGVTWARGNSNLCLAYAVLLEAHPQRQRFSIYEVPRSRLEDHLRSTIRTLCLSNKNCDRTKAAKHTWGGPSWQSALETIGWAWAAHVREKCLDSDTLTLVREIVCKEADHLEKEIPSGKLGNTRSEDCCWNAPLLAFAANKYADHPRASRWDELCKQWAVNAVSIGADASSTEIVDGRALEDWIVSENMHPDLTIENHGMWSVGYQCASQHLGEAALAYRLFGRPTPAALGHHADAMWRNVTSALFLWDGDILFPHGQDWSWKVYSSIEYLCWQNCSRRNQAAGALESRALQMVYRRQLALGTGDLGAAVSPLLDFGNQTVKPKRWAFCYLMHERFAEPEPMSAEEAELGALGVHVYLFTKVAIHRTRKKCVSVSWHPRFQPIYILPEGHTTYTEPPFFFPYDRDSGCARLRVAAGHLRITSRHQHPRHPAEHAADGDDSTFWVSGSGASRRADGPTNERPEWIQLEFREPLSASTLVLRPREGYGPRRFELQISNDGKVFEPVARFNATGEPRQTFAFPEQTSRIFRVLISSAYDPRSPKEPRNVQIREIGLLEAGEEESPEAESRAPVLHEASATPDGRGMRVTYRKAWPGGITQFVIVHSLPDEATAYCTAFRAARDAVVTIEPLFPLRAAAPPGFERPIRQYRGSRWLNMSDHVGFVSIDPLPDDIPANRFFLTARRTMDVQQGDWFGRAVLLVFARQPHEVTAEFAGKVRLTDDSHPERFTVVIDGPDDATLLDVDFARPPK